MTWAMHRVPKSWPLLVRFVQGKPGAAVVAEAIRQVVDVPASLDSPDPLGRALAEAQLHAPGYTLRGGTNEILRGIVARGLGLR